MDIKDIKDLIITMDKTTIETVEIEKNDLKIKISKGIASKAGELKIDEGNLASNHLEGERVSQDIEEIESVTAREEYNTFVVKSPIVGTFYKASSPDSLPFVNIGDTVEKGQILCIIEAMKIMNEIECEHEGEVIEIFVENEDIVEFGQPLMLIRR